MKVNGVGGRDLDYPVEVHQGSVLSPLLFIIVMERCPEGLMTEDCLGSCCMQIADVLVLLADSEDDLKRKLQRWKNRLFGEKEVDKRQGLLTWMMDQNLNLLNFVTLVICYVQEGSRGSLYN